MECTGAIRSSQTPNAAAPRNMTRQVVRDTAAAESAPRSAPAPKQAEMIPKVRGPASSVVFASSGRRMLKLKPTAVNTAVIARVTRTVRLWRA